MCIARLCCPGREGIRWHLCHRIATCIQRQRSRRCSASLVLGGAAAAFQHACGAKGDGGQPGRICFCLAPSLRPARDMSSRPRGCELASVFCLGVPFGQQSGHTGRMATDVAQCLERPLATLPRYPWDAA